MLDADRGAARTTCGAGARSRARASTLTDASPLRRSCVALRTASPVRSRLDRSRPAPPDRAPDPLTPYAVITNRSPSTSARTKFLKNGGSSQSSTSETRPGSNPPRANHACRGKDQRRKQPRASRNAHRAGRGTLAASQARRRDPARAARRRSRRPGRREYRAASPRLHGVSRCHRRSECDRIGAQRIAARRKDDPAALVDFRPIDLRDLMRRSHERAAAARDDAGRSRRPSVELRPSAVGSDGCPRRPSRRSCFPDPSSTFQSSRRDVASLPSGARIRRGLKLASRVDRLAADQQLRLRRRRRRA